MEPVVRPVLTVAEKAGKFFVAAEIPAIDIAERPCYYKGRGRLKGSYTRIGDSDEPMTEYEVYSYEAYRKKYQDDVRIVARATLAALDKNALEKYIILLKEGKPNLGRLDTQSIYELMSITRENSVTLSSVMLFSPYPQAYFPQLCITAIVVPGNEIGDVDDDGARFADNMRIEGTLPLMLETAIQFVKRNMHHKTIINPDTGKREDRTDYPITAVREAILNALVHRDYSIHTEGMPIQIIMYDDRLEIRNPGGIYGRMSIDQLGKIQADTRNPVIAAALEVLGVTENRYSGIPTIRRAMEAYNLLPPEFLDERGSFIVKFYKKNIAQNQSDELVDFCRTPRSRQEICDFLGIKTPFYAIKQYVQPLIDSGKIKLLIPDVPGSHKQKYYSAE
jgi:ATP-dependent DNA helicase RecG